MSLSTYLVYLRVNEPFDPAAYYAGADEEGIWTYSLMSIPRRQGVILQTIM